MFSKHFHGHHKLTSWRIVINDAISGCSEMIAYFQCHNKTLAATILHVFLDAISIHSLLSIDRADFGVRNVNAVRFMLDCPKRGIKRGSFIAGTSVHNQCIEGIWVEVIRYVLRHFRIIFLFLGNDGFLDLLNEVHLFELHYAYMLRIKKALEKFSNNWRYYSLSSERNQSPYQISNYGVTKLIHLDPASEEIIGITDWIE